MLGVDPGVAPSPFVEHVRTCRSRREYVAAFLGDLDLPVDEDGVPLFGDLSPLTAPLHAVLAFACTLPVQRVSHEASMLLRFWLATVDRIVWTMLMPRLPLLFVHGPLHSLPRNHPAAVEFRTALLGMSWTDVRAVVEGGEGGGWERASEDGAVFPSKYDWVGAGCPELGIPTPAYIAAASTPFDPTPPTPHVPEADVRAWIEELVAYRDRKEEHRMRTIQFEVEMQKLRDIRACFERGVTRDELLTFILSSVDAMAVREVRVAKDAGTAFVPEREGIWRTQRGEEGDGVEEEAKRERSWRVKALVLRDKALDAFVARKLYDHGRPEEQDSMLLMLNAFDEFREDLLWAVPGASRDDVRRALLSTFPPLSSIPYTQAARDTLNRRASGLLRPPAPPAYPQLKNAQLDNHLPLRSQHGLSRVDQARTLGSVRAEVARRLAGEP